MFYQDFLGKALNLVNHDALDFMYHFTKVMAPLCSWVPNIIINDAKTLCKMQHKQNSNASSFHRFKIILEPVHFFLVPEKNCLDMGQKVTFWYCSNWFGAYMIALFLSRIYFGPNEEQGISALIILSSSRPWFLLNKRLHYLATITPTTWSSMAMCDKLNQFYNETLF